MGELIAAHRPDLVVIACNTASTLVLPQLRARFAVPFVGTVPAIKPACAASQHASSCRCSAPRRRSKREYTRALIRDFANGCEVTLVGSARLAELAEAELRGEPVERRRHRSRDRALLRRRRTAGAPTRSCSPAPIIRCCSTGLQRLAPWPVDLHRSGAGDRAPRGRAARTGGARRRRRRPRDRLHLRPRRPRPRWPRRLAAISGSQARGARAPEQFDTAPLSP